MDFLKEFVSFGTVITPIMILLVIVALVAVVRILARNYIKVAPNAVLTIYGRKYKGDRGFKLVTGGAAFCIPLLEKYEMMKLDAFKIDITVRNVPSEQGVPVDVSAVAVLKIGREDEMLEAAVSRFLGQTQQELQVIVQGQMEGALRGVVATMSVESLIKDRTTFGNRVQEQITGDLEKLGIRMDSLVIQEITDNQGYIEALGKKQTAMVKRDASIAEAEARRDEDILVAEALRQAAVDNPRFRQHSDQGLGLPLEICFQVAEGGFHKVAFCVNSGAHISPGHIGGQNGQLLRLVHRSVPLKISPAVVIAQNPQKQGVVLLGCELIADPEPVTAHSF